MNCLTNFFKIGLKSAPILALAFAMSSTTCFASCNKIHSDLSSKAIEKRTAPIGQVTIGADLPTSPADLGPDAGPKRYEANCAMCHASGLAGAPKFGDKAAWAPRAGKGIDNLLKSVVHGLNAMPPRGGCTTCSDEELKLTIEYMLSKVK